MKYLIRVEACDGTNYFVDHSGYQRTAEEVDAGICYLGKSREFLETMVRQYTNWNKFYVERYPNQYKPLKYAVVEVA